MEGMKHERRKLGDWAEPGFFSFLFLCVNLWAEVELWAGAWMGEGLSGAGNVGDVGNTGWRMGFFSFMLAFWI